MGLRCLSLVTALPFTFTGQSYLPQGLPASTFHKICPWQLNDQYQHAPFYFSLIILEFLTDGLMAHIRL